MVAKRNQSIAALAAPPLLVLLYHLLLSLFLSLGQIACTNTAGVLGQQQQRQQSKINKARRGDQGVFLCVCVCVKVIKASAVVNTPTYLTFKIRAYI